MAGSSNKACAAQPRLCSFFSFSGCAQSGAPPPSLVQGRNITRALPPSAIGYFPHPFCTWTAGSSYMAHKTSQLVAIGRTLKMCCHVKNSEKGILTVPVTRQLLAARVISPSKEDGKVWDLFLGRTSSEVLLKMNSPKKTKKPQLLWSTP